MGMEVTPFFTHVFFLWTGLSALIGAKWKYGFKYSFRSCRERKNQHGQDKQRKTIHLIIDGACEQKKRMVY